MVNRHHPNVKGEFMKELMVYAEEMGIDVWFFLDFPENWAGIIKHRPHLAGKNVDLSDFPTGETWDMDRMVVIRDDGMDIDLGYPASIQLEDGRILSTYYRHGEDGIRYIGSSIWSEEDAPR